ncbi:MAG: hypothetical protein HKN47_23650 [Pirellulaceae bacterium]|nr:hypothetical protein [Pirellulaceae bacterium]
MISAFDKPRRGIRFFNAVLALVFVLNIGCDRRREGTIMMVDGRYEPVIAATESIGIASPDGLLFQDGRIFIADEGGSACRAWNPQLSGDSAALVTFCDESSGIRSPEDLVRDADGNIYFSDDDAGGVWHLDAAGRCQRLTDPSSGLAETEAIALTPDGDLLVGDAIGHRVCRVTKDGNVSDFLGPEHHINKPESMVFGDDGELYIADNRDRVLYRWTASDGLRRLISQQKLFSPESICYSKGAVYITDSSSGRLSRYSQTNGLQTIAIFGGSMRSIQGITIDDQDNIYLSVQADLKRKQGYIIALKRTPG